jgi:hypothetical protein
MSDRKITDRKMGTVEWRGLREGGDMDKSKSLQQLEEHDWGEPAFESHLVQTCHRLRRKPLDEFTPEDLRIMIGQAIGLDYLVPLALDKLECDPFTGGDFFPGDLLAAVFGVDDSFWAAHPALESRVKAIPGRARASLVDLDEDQREVIEELLVDKSRSSGRLKL